MWRRSRHVQFAENDWMRFVLTCWIVHAGRYSHIDVAEDTTMCVRAGAWVSQEKDERELRNTRTVDRNDHQELRLYFLLFFLAWGLSPSPFLLFVPNDEFC